MGGGLGHEGNLMQWREDCITAMRVKEGECGHGDTAGVGHEVALGGPLGAVGRGAACKWASFPVDTDRRGS